MTFFDWKFYTEKYKLDINNKEKTYNDWLINNNRQINRFIIFKNKIDYQFCIYYYNICSKSLKQNITFAISKESLKQ